MVVNNGICSILKFPNGKLITIIHKNLTEMSRDRDNIIRLFAFSKANEHTLVTYCVSVYLLCFE